MTADVFTIPGAILDCLTTLGIDGERVMQDAGIAMARFREPKARLTTAEFLAVWRALQAIAPPDFGLQLASQALPHHHNVATTAALHSARLGDALAKKARYKRLTCPQEILVELVGGEARVRSRWPLADGGLPRLLIDTTFASIVNLARQGTGTELAPSRIELARRRPAARTAAAFAQHFACEIRFDAPGDAIVFDQRALALPFVTHDPELVALLAAGLEAELDARSRGRTLADDVRQALRRRMSGERPSVDKVAAELHVSSRTLQRRLGELGTSYQALLEDVRHECARNLLATTDLETSEVAFLLGFEELNSFTRAFHLWEGASPNHWRHIGCAESVARRA